MNFGTCPKCERKLHDAVSEPITIGKPPQPQWRGISFLCPYCKIVLGIGIDPVAMINETVEQIMERLQGQAPAESEESVPA